MSKNFEHKDIYTKNKGVKKEIHNLFKLKDTLLMFYQIIIFFLFHFSIFVYISLCYNFFYIALLVMMSKFEVIETSR